MAITLDASEIKRIDCALQAWRQGDAVIDGDIFMVHLADRLHPLTDATRAAVADFSDEYTTIHVPTSVRGLVVCGFRGDAGHHSDLIPAGIPN